MKKHWLGSAAIIVAAASLVAFTQIATAADMPVKAPVYTAPVPAQPDWTGFYAGINGGYSVAANRSTYTVFVNPVIGFDNAESYKVSPAGMLGGLQLGYNWQTGSLVFGVEGDIQGTGQKNTVCVVTCSAAFGFLGTVEQKLPWFATVRGRAGVTVGRSLFYVTGGAAFGEVKTSVTEVNGPAVTVSESKTKSGWTVGGGIETGLTGNWTAKFEYLYVDLGSQTLSSVDAAGPPSFIVATADMRDHIVRAGLNYRFGGPIARAPDMPVKAPVARIANWNGLYAGLNVGYGVGRDPTSYSESGIGFSIAERFYIAPAGIIGGGQVGYNWQFGQLVAGIESDIQASAMRDSACVDGCIHNAFFNLAANVEQKLPWLGTTRGRLGYVADSGALLYLTGGVAYGEHKTTINHVQGTITATVTSSETKAGWVIGGGIEIPLDRHWKAKAEYLYVDLGSQAITFAAGPLPVTETSSFRENIFRVGLNYGFN